MKIIFSVEIEQTMYADDLFNGTFEECVAYCKEHDYTRENSDVRIAEIEIDEDGCVIDCLDIITEF